MKSSTNTDDSTEGGRLRLEANRLGGTTVLGRLMGVDPALFYKYFVGKSNIGIALEVKLTAAGVNMDYVRGRVSDPETFRKKDINSDNFVRVSTRSNVGALFRDAPTSVDILQPVLRQRIHAGGGMPIVEETAELYNVTKAYRDTVTVEVVGDSMIDAGIKEGDRCVIKTDKPPHNGDVVLALLNGEYYLKGYERDSDNRAVLWPANENYEPIYVQVDDDFQIEGVMIELIRKSDRSWLAKRKSKHKRKG